MGKFLNFDKMLTPIFIKIAFWIGVIISFIVGIGTIFSGFIGGFNSVIDGSMQIIIGVLIIIIGPLIIRVYCELLIVLFKMHESMQEIKTVLRDQAKPVPDREMY